MNSTTIIANLRENEAELKAAGFEHIALHAPMPVPYFLFVPRTIARYRTLGLTIVAA